MVPSSKPHLDQFYCLMHTFGTGTMAIELCHQPFYVGTHYISTICTDDVLTGVRDETVTGTDLYSTSFLSTTFFSTVYIYNF